MWQQLSLMPIRVLLIDQDEGARLSLRHALELDSTIQVVADFKGGEQALSFLQGDFVDVLVTDINLADGPATNLITDCSRRYPKCSIMVLSHESDDANILACIEAGGSGYLSKNLSAREIGRQIIALHAGATSINMLVARKVIELTKNIEGGGHTSKLQVSFSKQISLTNREKTILTLISQGETCEVIAHSLRVSTAGVQAHLKKIYRKLVVQSQDEAISVAYQAGILKR